MPNAQVAALLPPGLQALGRTQIAAEVGMPDTLINTDKNNFSPRVGFAWRVGGNDKTVLRGGFGLFHPTVAIQGLRDLLASNMFRYSATRTAPPLAHGFSGGTPYVDPADFGNQGIDPNIQSPDIYQYNLTLERELRRRLRPARELHRLDDAEAPGRPRLQHDAGQHGVLRPVQPRRPRAAALPPVRLLHGQRGEPRRAASSTPAQVELRRRWKDGLALNVAYTLRPLERQRPRLRQQQRGRRACSTPTTSRRTRARTRTW